MGNLCSSNTITAPIPLIDKRLSLRNVIYSMKKSPKTLYNNMHMIGKGTSSFVYLVQKKKNTQTRALKEVHKSTIDFTSRTSLSDEMMILSSLDHPNIVRVFEIIDTSNYIYITSEYLEGGVLLEKLSKKKFLSENQARFYMFDILYAINYCHLKGIIHSDLKPENLLFTKKENGRNIVKINDFSTSRISLNRSNKNSQLSGTIYYMSPEQLEGHISEKSDIWSVGVILYMMLSNLYPAGRPPFIGETIDSTADLIISEPVDCEDENLINYSNQVKDLLEKLLDKDPELRPSAEAALRDPWFSQIQNNKPEKTFCVNLLQNLIKFTVIPNKSLPGIVKAVLRVICYHCKEVYNQTEIIEFFKYIDRSNSGDISIDDLNLALNELELFEDAKGLMEKLCVERGHTLTYSDFVVATVNWKEELSPGLFLNLLDSTEKERISLLEMRKIFPNILDHELNSFFSKITNGDQGSVTVQKLYEEIKALIVANSL